MAPERPRSRVAFVLGGGGRLGAAEVGMLEALADCGVVPDMVLGASIGAVNGAVVASDPSPAGVGRLRDLWGGAAARGIFGGRVVDRLRHVASSRTSLHSSEPLRRLLTEVVAEDLIEELSVRFECVAACIETAREEWFTTGPLVEAVLASCAVPGLFPAVRIKGRHYIDGGIVDSIPIGRALELGATVVYVIHVGRIEEPLKVPRFPHEVALVAFEIARRKSFSSAMSSLPEGVDVHVLPTGVSGPRFNDLRQLRYRDMSEGEARIDRARAATEAYLLGLTDEGIGRGR